MVHVPLVTPLDPCRNRPAGHVGCAVQAKLLAVNAQAPVRYSPSLQLTLSHALQAKPSVVPEQVPERYLLAGHAAFEHVLHVKPSLAPLHEPARNWPGGHVWREQVEHVLSAARFGPGIESRLSL